jgi:hemolysin activation/secretion protein
MAIRVVKRNTLFLSLLSCVCIAVEAGAAPAPTPTPTSIPGSVDPSRIGNMDSMKAAPTLDRQPATDAKPAQTGDVVIPGADQVVFVLVDFKIEGMEAYEQGKFLGQYIHLIGKPVTLQQVIDVVNTINRTYRDDGYIFSRAFLPEQDITNGVVTMQVVEGRIDNVIMAEAVAEKAGDLQPYLDKIAAVRPFNINKFEHWLLVLNDLPGSRFRSVLRQPDQAAQPGAIEVVLLEEELPSTTVAEINNQGSLYAGPFQANLSHDHANVFDDYDQVSLRLSATIPWDEVKYAQIGYKRPINAIPGLAFNTHIGWGGTVSGSNLDELDVKGLVREWRVGLSYAAILSRRTNWLMYLNFDMKNATSKILGDNLYDDRMRVVRASTAFQHLDSFDGATLMTAEISQGLDVLGARETGSGNLSRADGHSDFTKISAQVSRLQTLPAAFQMLAQVSGQYAFDPLLSAEEFGHGGVPSGRGYDPSEFTGDHGMSATLELRYNGLQPMSDFVFQPYTFVDFGRVWQKGNNTEDSISALSTGFGSRIDYGDATSINVMMAIPLTRKSDNPPKYANGESPRYLFSLTRRF